MKLYITEFVGTFFLTLAVGLSGRSDLAPLAIGGVLMLMVYAGGYISGGHYNPAVSLSAALSRALPALRLRKYVAVQILAAFVGALVSHGISGQALVPAPTQPIIFAPLVLEVLFTFALCYVVLHTAVAKNAKGNQYYGVAIGGTLMLAAIIAGPISGAVLNPAIGIGSFLASVVAGAAMPLSSLLLYIVGPMTGAVLAAAVFGMQRD